MSTERCKNETKKTFAKRANMSGIVVFVLAFIKDFIEAFNPEASLNVVFGLAAILIMCLIFCMRPDRINKIELGTFTKKQGFEGITAASALLFCVENVFGSFEMKLFFSALAFAMIVVISKKYMKCHGWG